MRTVEQCDWDIDMSNCTYANVTRVIRDNDLSKLSTMVWSQARAWVSDYVASLKMKVLLKIENLHNNFLANHQRFVFYKSPGIGICIGKQYT